MSSGPTAMGTEMGTGWSIDSDGMGKSWHSSSLVGNIQWDSGWEAVLGVEAIGHS